MSIAGCGWREMESRTLESAAWKTSMDQDMTLLI